MFSSTNGSSRETFPARERVDRDLLEQMMAEGTIIVDNRRRRPLYFDGRFLAARDLMREQNYFLSRQSDIGRVAGGGVIHGLLVSSGSTAFSIIIERGHGVTSAGEIIVLDRTISVDLTNITEMQQLDAAFGISRIPSESSRNRSGLFIVALRPVEYTANPIASYPTTITGSRSIEDGDIVEAVAVTLVPYRDQSSNTDFLSRRARVAREIFVNRASRGIPSATLPLAMIALDGGVVRWIAPFMVRREVGAEHGNTIGLGFAPRALREAHLLEYEAHLGEVLRLRATRGLRFAATEHFQCLPPAGRVPAATIDPTDFSQMYFPAEIDVDLSIVPADEVPVLLEESMFLPPIDLTLSGADQDSTSVQILIPVPRERLRLLLNSLASTTRSLKPAAPGLVAKRKPLESLLALTLPRATEIVAAAGVPADSVWANALGVPSDRMLWYVRRRNLQYKSEFVGAEVRAAGEESEAERKLVERLKGMGLDTRFDDLGKAATSIAKAELVTFLDSPKFVRSKLMMVAAVRELEEKIQSDRRLERIEILTVGDRFSDPRAGEGLEQLEQISPEFKAGFEKETFIKTFAETLLVPEVDRLARPLSEDDREIFAKSLLDAGSGGDVQSLLNLVTTFVKEGGKITRPEDGTPFAERLKKLGLGARFERLAKGATAGTRAIMLKVLGQDRFRAKLMLTGAIRDLEINLAAGAKLESALATLEKSFSYDDAGFGIERFENSSEEFRNDKFVNPIAETQMVPEVDRIFATIILKDLDSTPAERLLKVAATGDVKSLSALIASSLKAQAAPSEVSKEEAILVERLKKLGLSASFESLSQEGGKGGHKELVAFLSSPRFARSALMLTAGVQELNTHFIMAQTFGEALRRAQESFSDSTGEGIAALENISPDFKNEKIIAALTNLLIIPQLDRIARLTTDAASLTKKAEQVLKTARSGDRNALLLLITKLDAELKK